QLLDVHVERINLAEEACHAFQVVPVGPAREQAPHVAHHAVDGGGVLHDLLYAAHDVAGYVPEEAIDLVEDTVPRGRAVDAVQPADHCLEHVLHQQDDAAPDQLQVAPPGLQHRLVLAPSPDLSLSLADDPFQALDYLLQLVYFILRIFQLLPQPRQLVGRRALFHIPLIDCGVFLDLGDLIVDREAQKVAPCTATSSSSPSSQSQCKLILMATHTPASVTPIFRVLSAARVAKGHAARGLDRRQGVVVGFAVEQP
ncbi:hypothetical protein JX266_014356, partial [Neoarthrinium moseri]